MELLSFENNIDEITKNPLFSFQHDTGINADGSFRLFQGKILKLRQ